jgi:hypothetical protein
VEFDVARVSALEKVNEKRREEPRDDGSGVRDDGGEAIVVGGSRGGEWIECVHGFKGIFVRGPKEISPNVPRTSERSETGESLERAVVCGACRSMLTTLRERIEVDGRHQHTFVNPSAYAFTIVLFKNAPGCVPFGERSTYFTWFEKHAWQVALCKACGAHIGWFFSGLSTFIGLIIDRIAF